MSEPAALERLGVFIGTWSVEASFPGAPPSGPVGSTLFEWTLGRRFVLQRSEVSHPDAPDGLMVIGLSTDGQGYTQHYFDSRGIARVYAMTFSEGVWTLLREAPDFTPLDFSQGYIGTLSDDANTIDGRWETFSDGAGWELDFGLSYRRIG